MCPELEVGGDEFRSLSHNGRIAKCREKAVEAGGLAANAANQEKRTEYSDLASKWIALADEMAKSRDEGNQLARAT